jgi:DNA-binding transcriptional ArsR family regulator
MPEESERLARLERQLEAILRRLDGIEARSGPSQRADEPALKVRSDEADDQEALSIAGRLRVGNRKFNFQHRASWAEVLEADPEVVATVFAALGSPFRLRLLRTLMDGPQTTQDLQTKLSVAAPGQLYHHLKELLAAGLIAQRRRGVYAIREEAVMPVLLAFVVAPRLAPQPRPALDGATEHSENEETK